MTLTETIPTKFPEQDVRIMDTLIQRGIFISRSDLIREATREKMKESLQTKTYGDILVKQMAENGDFDRLENKILAKLLLDQKPLSLADFSKVEQKTIRKLLRHPFGLLKSIKGALQLTENGQSIARGYLKGLSHAKTLF